MRHPLRVVMPVVAALLLISIGHGLPHRYVPDDHAVRCALGIARDLGNPDLPRLTALVPPSAATRRKSALSKASMSTAALGSTD